MPVVKKTATGARSTDEEVLEKLAEDYPLPAKLLEHRSLTKLKGTYTDKLAQLATAAHRPRAHALRAGRGRHRPLSSNDPNLQNIPIRTAEGRRVREAFVAPPGCVIASADYSQIELRIMAHISGDHALLHAFHAGLDVHKRHRQPRCSARRWTRGDERAAPLRQGHQLRPDLRHGRFGLAKNLGIETKAAKDYIDKYFRALPA
jgi:DNA polymerase-1